MKSLAHNKSLSMYGKWGKIRWAKLSQIPPYEVFHGKAFAVPYVLQYLSNAIIYSL